MHHFWERKFVRIFRKRIRSYFREKSRSPFLGEKIRSLLLREKMHSYVLTGKVSSYFLEENYHTLYFLRENYLKIRLDFRSFMPRSFFFQISEGIFTRISRKTTSNINDTQFYLFQIEQFHLTVYLWNIRIFDRFQNGKKINYDDWWLQFGACFENMF